MEKEKGITKERMNAVRVARNNGFVARALLRMKLTKMKANAMRPKIPVVASSSST
jgi:hypothetical protein